MSKPEKRIRHGRVRWYARYRDPDGQQRVQVFDRQVDAKAFLDDAHSAIRKGAYVTPEAASTTVAEWCKTWRDGYASRRKTTVQQADTHLVRIVARFGSMPLSAVRPSQVKGWIAQLQVEGLAPSYVYALHARLAQVMGDAVHDGILLRSPCSRRTSPPAGKQRAYCATTEQVWELHDAMPEHLRVAVLLGALAGLRVAETCGLRVSDVDFMRGIVSPAVQYPAEPLKNDTSRTAIPIPQSFAAQLSAHVAQWPADTLLTDQWGHQLAPWTLDRAFRVARESIAGLPEGFRTTTCGTTSASLLIADGADLKVVQARLRHTSAKTTYDTYMHLWPDRDDSTRDTVGAVFATRALQHRTAQ